MIAVNSRTHVSLGRAASDEIESMVRERNYPTVAIIGGGFSGGVVAARLAAQLGEADIRIIVVEPREQLGRGLAYDTDNPSHRINVPADRMTLDPGNELDFVAWLEQRQEAEKDPSSRTSDGKLYPRRGLFGQYVSDFVAPFLQNGVVRHVRDRVSRVKRRQASWHIETEEGLSFDADFLVLATSHPAPSAPSAFLRSLGGHPRFIADTTVPRALDAIREADRVLVVGAGLTAADVIATLDARGHRGDITFYSRRGLRSKGHARVSQAAFGDFAASPSRTALGLLQQVRSQLDLAKRQGISWHAVFDAIRNDAGSIWRNLPIVERQRLVRHLRSFWDVHRFRIAPQVEDVIDARLASGTLRLLAAKATEVESTDKQIWVTLKHRHRLATERTAYDAVVITTGPAHGGIFASQPWLPEMAKDGLLELDPTGLGLLCDEDSRAVTKDTGVTPGLYVSGPLARGTFGELMGLPQVSDHATLVATNLAKAIAEARTIAEAS